MVSSVGVGGGVCQLTTSRNEGARGELLVQEGEQTPAALGQTLRSAESRRRAAQDSGRASSLLVVDPTTAQGGLRRILQIRILRHMTGAHNNTHSEKSGRYGVGRTRAQESVRLQQDHKMTRPEDHLDKLLVKDVERLAGTGSYFGEDRGPNLGPGELRSTSAFPSSAHSTTSS